MNASTIINDSMTLEDKLKAIDEAMKVALQKQQVDSGRVDAPSDPSLLLICDGCE